MITANAIVDLFTIKGFAGLMEFLFLVLEFIYILYAFMVTRQVKLMNRSFETPAAPLFTSLAFLQFIAAVFIVIVTIIFS